MEYMLTFHILNVYVDKTQPRQFKFTFKDNFIYLGNSAVNQYQHCWEGTSGGLASCPGESVQVNCPISCLRQMEPGLIVAVFSIRVEVTAQAGYVISILREIELFEQTN